MIITSWFKPGPIRIPLPPSTSVNGGACFGAVILAVSGPVPVLPIVIIADAVAAGDALSLTFFGFTEMRPPPGVAVAVGVGVSVAVIVAEGVAVAVGAPLVDVA